MQLADYDTALKRIRKLNSSTHGNQGKMRGIQVPWMLKQPNAYSSL